MRRPALSALRAIQILDQLGANPGRAFTMSEIMRVTDINVASCHSILAALTERGYLRRCNQQKTYTLGPAMAALGQAAFAAEPLLTRVRGEADRLVKKLGQSVLVTAVVGDEILAVLSLDRSTRGSSNVLQVGQRVPFAPPLGGPFVAWSSKEEMDRWMDRLGRDDDGLRAEWRRALSLVKQRGYQITLRPPDAQLSAVLNEIAAGRAPFGAQREWQRYFELGDRRPLQPETIDPEQVYPVILIAAPIFDDTGQVLYCLSLTKFEETTSGAQIETMAQQLLQSCMQIMRT